MNEETKKIVDFYTAKGWNFFTSSTMLPENKLLVWQHYRSPRMDANGTIKEDFDEHELLDAECEYYARQVHGAQIGIAFGQATHNLIHQLAMIYRRQPWDKSAIIPSQVTVSNIVINLAPGTQNVTGLGKEED